MTAACCGTCENAGVDEITGMRDSGMNMLPAREFPGAGYRMSLFPAGGCQTTGTATLLRAMLIGITLGVISTAGAREAGDSALHRLDATVQKSCACAAAQKSGVRAALACTGELKTFSALKLDNAQRWSPPQRRLAGRLEQILETCLSEALSYRRTLIRLGVEAPFAAPPAVPLKTAAPYAWKKIQPSRLGQYPSRLVRIETRAGKSIKGLVSDLSRDSLRLLRARGDGGGSLSFELEAIHGAWVLLPAAPDPARR